MRHKLLISLIVNTLLLVNCFDDSGKLATTIDKNKRVNCIPEPSETQVTCQQRGCIWDSANYDKKLQIPTCYYPPETGYFIKNSDGKSHEVWKKAPKAVKSPYSTDFDEINVDHYEIGGGIHLVIGTDGRYTPSVEINRKVSITSEEKLVYKTQNSSSISSFTIERQTDGVKIWDTSLGNFLFSDQYIQISTNLPTDRIYGFGEQIHQSLKHDLSTGFYKTWPIFARDQVPDSSHETRQNLYGVHNFYLGLEDGGKSHGVFLLNSNAQEVTLGPAPHLTYRTIGGQLEFFFLPGPEPTQVIEQYHAIIGKPYLPAYWAFGYQLSRYGYKDLNELKSVITNVQAANIPLDVVYADIDYMEDKKDFTTDNKKWAGFGKYVQELQKNNVKTTLIFDPAIEVDYGSFKRALDKKASFVSWPDASLVPHKIQDLYPLAKDTSVMLGVVWPDNHVAFPDFYDETNKTNQWWIDEFVNYHKDVPFDGIWIDMNEPSVFSTNRPKAPLPPRHPPIGVLTCPSDSPLENPPYRTWNVYTAEQKDGERRLLSDVTLCSIGTVNGGKENIYNAKSLYGLKETIATNKALEATTKKRGQVISRSTFPTSGKYGGHWLGDNSATWNDLKTSIIGIQEFNMFGIPHVGADVCDNTNEDLCLRWQQLGSFYSFFRNHNDIASIPQSPDVWKSVATATRESNLFRYKHLPYLYSLHVLSSMNGGMVVHPMFFNFPTDKQTYDLSYQFMWGSAIAVVPVISPNVEKVKGYLPLSADWFYLYGPSYGQLVNKDVTEFDAPRNTTAPVFVRGGNIIPRQVPQKTLTETHAQNFQLLIVCNQVQAPLNKADGFMHWDDGESLINAQTTNDWLDATYHLKFSFTTDSSKSKLQVQMVNKPKKLLNNLPPIEQIEIFNYPTKPAFKNLQLNSKSVKLEDGQLDYDATKKVLRLKNSKTGLIQLNEHLDQWTLEWSEKESSNSASSKWLSSLTLFTSVLVLMKFVN